MSAREATDWLAWEQVNGPILAHDRIDIGFAQVCYLLVQLLADQKTRRRYKVQDFLPPWWKDRAEPRDEGMDAFRFLFRSAQNYHEIEHELDPMLRTPRDER
jgi:hypothetical protein